MSYILDALKRSDRERREGTVPDLESVHVAPVLSAPTRWSSSSILLLLVLLGNIIFASLWVYESLFKDKDAAKPVAGSNDVRMRLAEEADGAYSGVDSMRNEGSANPQAEAVSGDAKAVGDAFAAYLARQGVGQQGEQENRPEFDAGESTLGQPNAANIALPKEPVSELPAIKRRNLPPKFEDLSPGNDPYASLFDNSSTKETTAANAPSKTQSHSPSSAKETASSKPVQETALLPGEEIIRPRSGESAPQPPPSNASALSQQTAQRSGTTGQAKGGATSTRQRVGPRVTGPVTWDSVPLLEELPEVVRAELPPLNFNSHMFSSDPRFRTVIINGKSLRERDYLDPRTRLMLITEAGVVLQFDEVRFKVAVLEEWEQ